MQVRSVQRAIHFVRVGSSSVRDSKNIKSLVLLSPHCLSLPLCKTYRTQQRICRCLVAHKTTCEAGVLSFCRTSEVTSPVLLLLHPPPLPPPPLPFLGKRTACRRVLGACVLYLLTSIGPRLFSRHDACTRVSLLPRLNSTMNFLCSELAPKSISIIVSCCA